MSRRFFGTGYLTRASAPVTGVPITMACWYLPSAPMSSAHPLIRLAQSIGSQDNSYLLGVGSTTVRARARLSSDVDATVTSRAEVGTWSHAAGVWASTASRIAYWNGIGGTENTTSVNPSASTATTSLGLIVTGFGRWAGCIAHPAIWNVALTPEEIRTLAQGASPDSVRPDALVTYVPRLGLNAPEVDVVNATVFAEAGGGTVPDYREPPRLWTPKRRIWAPVAGSAQVIEAGISAETDSAFGLTWRKTKAIGLNAETDSGFAVARVKAKAVGLNTETDSGLALARFKVKTVGLNTETDAPFAVAKAKRYAAGLNTETDTALPVSGAQAILAGLAEAIDTALAVTKRIAKAVGLTTETDEALPVANATVVPVGQASESDSAFSVAKLKRKLVGLAREFDSAKKVTSNATVSWGLKFPLIRPMVRNLIQSWRSRRFPWKEPF